MCTFLCANTEYFVFTLSLVTNPPSIFKYSVGEYIFYISSPVRAQSCSILQRQNILLITIPTSEYTCVSKLCWLEQICKTNITKIIHFWSYFVSLTSSSFKNVLCAHVWTQFFLNWSTVCRCNSPILPQSTISICVSIWMSSHLYETFGQIFVIIWDKGWCGSMLIENGTPGLLILPVRAIFLAKTLHVLLFLLLYFKTWCDLNLDVVLGWT